MRDKLTVRAGEWGAHSGGRTVAKSQHAAQGQGGVWPASALGTLWGRCPVLRLCPVCGENSCVKEG